MSPKQQMNISFVLPGMECSKLIMVRWNEPSSGWYKLNTDGLALGNLGRASGGGLIRDSNGFVGQRFYWENWACH